MEEEQKEIREGAQNVDIYKDFLIDFKEFYPYNRKII